MTELRPKSRDEKTRAAFFDNYGSEPLRRGDSVVLSPGSPTRLPPGAPRPSYLPFMQRLVCSTDAVVVGEVASARPLLNARGTFLFTDHDVRVEDWIHPIGLIESSVMVSVAGGSVFVGGVPTEARAGRLPEVGYRHLFFLRRIAGTNSFTTARRTVPVGGKVSDAILGLNGPTPAELSEEVPFESFLDHIRQVSAQCANPF